MKFSVVVTQIFLGQIEYAGFSLSVAGKKGKGISQKEIYKLEAAGLAQSLERLTAERDVVDSIAGVGQILKGTPFALQSARPSRGSDDHLKWRLRLQ